MNWREARFPEETAATDRVLCAYAEKSTRTPAAMGREDVEGLRAVGLTDTDIHDAVQVIGFFNYINRVADCLGVDDEPVRGSDDQDGEDDEGASGSSS